MPSKIGDKVIRVQKIQQMLTGNTWFGTGWTAGTLSQSQFGNDVTAFVDAESDVQARKPGAVSARATAYTTVKQDLDAILAMVQAKANANR